MGSEVAERQEQTVDHEPVTPNQMLQIAVKQGKDLEYIRELMQLEREWKADRAREAYYIALAEFKKVPVNVVKDRTNTQYSSKYSSIGNLVNTVNPAMAPFGLNASWDIDQSEGIRVTCILAHTLGHSGRVTMSGPPDKSGSKNPLQEIKSTITYLKIATFEAVTGVVSNDANLDDDGNAAGAKTITPEQVNTLASMIHDTGSDFAKFLKFYKVEELESLPASKFGSAVAMLEKKRAK